MQIAEEHRIIIDRIRNLRTERGLSQAQFASLIGVSSGNVGSWETYKSLPGAIALKNIALNLECSLDWLILGVDKNISQFAQQKIEAIFDPDLKMMIDVLKTLMESGDTDLRGWAKIQFKTAFQEHCTKHEAEKKLHA